MNWKYKLLIFTILVTAVVIFVKLPSQAGKNVESATNTVAAPIVNGEFTEYANGIIGIAPHGFAISKPVKEMLAQDPDALRSRALFVRTKEQKRAARLEKLRAQGLSEEEIEIDQINIRNARTIKKIVPGAGLAEGKFKDPLVDEGQKSFELQTMPTPSLDFKGASQIDNAAQGIGPIAPPDANGDVGPDHYVSAVNLVFKVFDKAGKVLAGPVKNNSLFQNLPAGDPCRITNDGDPIILYDSLADRWHFSQFGIPSGTTSYQCVALSVTGDPTGAYYVWSYAYPGSLGNDFPKVGVWTDGYHMTFNQFSSLEPNASFVGLGILTQDRKKALAGDPATIAVYKNVGERDPDSGGALPGDIDGFVAPPEGLAQVIGEFRANDFGDPVDGLRLYRWAPDFLNPGISTFTVLPDLALAEFDARQPPGLEDIEQAGGSKLDSVSDRSMHRFAYRNLGTAKEPKNSYVGNFAVNVSGVNPVSAETYQSAIRWFEVRRTNDTFSVFDQGTHQSGSTDGVNGLNNWMGAIAQDNIGNIALGYSQASTTQNADIKIAGRTIPKSGGLNEGEALFFDARGSQTGSNRWGDYSSMNVDPVDDCTFWYTQEYYETTSSTGWSTRVGKFKFPQCTPPPTATIKGTVTFCDNNQPVDKASVNATGGFNRITGVTGEYEIKVSPGTYAVTAGRAGGLVSASGAKDINVGPGETAFANFCLNGVAVIATNVEPRIVSESCSLPNGVPDPSEQVTVSLPLQNTGAASTTNLTAELQAMGGVTNPSTPQNYGALAPGSAVASKNFTFTVAPNIACGSTITLTFKITNGSTPFGTITKTFVTGVLQPTRAQNFDSVTAPALPAGWTNVQIVGTGINWVTSTVSPSSPPNTAFANNAAVVSSAALVTPPILIEIADAQFSFKNFFETEDDYDGMVLEYSTDDGTNYVDIIRGGGSFVSGGYNGVISRGFDSPIRGRNAWTGNSNGFINTVVNLPASLKGQSVRFRWVMASDSSEAEGAGVRIDDVQYFGERKCAACVPGTVCQASQTKSRYDFDGDRDRKSDLSVFRPSNNTWYLRKGDGGFTGVPFGLSSDKLVPADYDGDGKADIAVYRDGTWFIQRSTAGFIGVPSFGAATDIPQPADFDGDGKADLAVFRPSNGGWYVYNLANDQVSSIQFGAPTDKPVVGDYDGDCKADYAVFRPAEGNWYVQRSKDGFLVRQFGASGDKLVPADYDGDGKTDIAVFRPSPSNGTWYLLQSAAGLRGVAFGFGTDLPVPADYDGDGKADVAVFRNGIWYQLQSTGGFKGEQFGEATDKPIPNVFIQQ